MATATAPQPTQTYIPGTEPPRIATLDELALKFKAQRDAWQEMGQDMMDAKAELLEAMEVHQDDLAIDADGNYVYPIPDTDQEAALICASPNVKVRKRKKIKVEQE